MACLHRSSMPARTARTGNYAGLIPSTPDWRFNATAGWENDAATVSFTARRLSSGVYSNAYIECTSGCPTSTAANQTINDNHIPVQSTSIPMRATGSHPDSTCLLPSTT